MKPTSALIAKQITALDGALASLQDHAEALAFEAVGGNREVASELAKTNSQIAGAQQDRAVLLNAHRRAQELEAEAREAAEVENRALHRTHALSAAQEALSAALAMDEAIAAFTTASAALVAAEATLRHHVRLAGEEIGQRLGRKDAASHGDFLLARIADGSAGRRADRTVAELVGAAWREYLPAMKENDDETN
jgi:hypothetical protein